MEVFIEAVRQFSCLWDTTSKEYRNVDKKDAAWKTIIKMKLMPEIIDIKTAKAEWKKLRDSHRESIKRIKASKSGQTASGENIWKYAEVMEFLLPYMKNRQRIRNSSHSPQNIEVEDNQNTMEVLSHTIDEIESSSTKVQDENQPNNTIGNRKRKANNVDIDDFLGDMEMNHRTQQEKRETRRMERKVQLKNPIDSFFESMAQSTKLMPTWMQICIKRKVFDVIIEAEDQLINYNPPSTTNYGYNTSAGTTPSSQPEESLNTYEPF